jgi:hypothetical protein
MYDISLGGRVGPAGYVGGAEAEDRQVTKDPLRPVVAHDADVISPLDAEGLQPRPEDRDGLPHLPKRRLLELAVLVLRPAEG